MIRERASFIGLFAFYCVAFIGISMLSAAQEPEKPTLTPRIVTATKQVTTFTGIERQMLQAVQKKDKAALEAMLTEDCNLHLPDADLLAGEDWLASVMSKDFVLKSFMIRQLDVADLGNAAVVSYDRVQESTHKGQNDGGEFYVVDLWKKDGDNWKLSDRYVSKVSSTPYMPKGPIKPTGKQ
ncbi:MAG TPA: nuclear transport factor 2 family protein [Candidatus Angelobacter sp.]|nr:nuclear transport factor 2 family protein [Candidatus Angelobacter sp.]